ncbi:uncharacterized protein LOC134261980 [Saccostrea cucullata]|uniref:uncharacterized protein LOC134261980 n=1 Tax=Saccostrea cuccullata TaxID=36930 RepID=UPI002ED390C2
MTASSSGVSSAMSASKANKSGIFLSIPRLTTKPNFLTKSNQEEVTDVPEEREIGEDPTTSADGLTQRTESNYGTDPIEQHDATTSMPQQSSKQSTKQIKRKAAAIAAAAVAAAAAATPPKAIRRPAPKPAVPRDPIVHARPPVVKPASRPAVPRDPIVHARSTTPEPKEVDVETTGSTYYNSNYYPDYYNYNSGFDGNDRSGKNQGDNTCPVFKETIMEHHIILRHGGCEIILSQDDAIRWFGRPTRPLVYSRKYL